MSCTERNFFPEFNIRLYDKNSESDFFFFLHQNQNIFFSNIGIQNIFLEKKHNPPLQVKWSFPNFFKITLVYDIYIKSRETNPWVKKVKNLLNGLGHSYIINNINSIKPNLDTIKPRIHDQCLQTQNANICDSQKLNIFQSVYNMGQRPPYVDVLNNRCDIEQQFVKSVLIH